MVSLSSISCLTSSLPFSQSCNDRLLRACFRTSSSATSPATRLYSSRLSDYPVDGFGRTTPSLKIYSDVRHTCTFLLMTAHLYFVLFWRLNPGFCLMMDSRALMLILLPLSFNDLSPALPTTYALLLHIYANNR